MKPKGMSDETWRKLHIRVKRYAIKYETQLREVLKEKHAKQASGY